MTLWLTIGLNALQTGIVLLVLALTPPSSLVRPALLPLLALLAISTLPVNRDGLPTKLAAGCTSMNTVGTFCLYLDTALLSRWSFSARGPTSSRGGQRNVRKEPPASENREQRNQSEQMWPRLRWAIFPSTAWRAPATPWQVKNVPAFNSKDAKRVPTRTRFLINRALTLTRCLLIIDLLSLFPQDLEKNAVMFSSQKIGFFSRLSDVSAEDIATRLVVTSVAWVSIYSVLQACHCFLSIVAVATNFNTVDEWPPMFGSLRDCYSIRKFWGLFWHQTLRQRISSPSHFITHSVLRLRHGTVAARYSNIFLAFLISGLLHVAEEYGTGVSVQQSGSMRFFYTQASGIILEDAVQALFNSSAVPQHRTWTRVIGYIWFGLWMVWSSPAWLYPKLQNNQGGTKDQFLPFTVLGHIPYEMILERL